MKILEDEEFYFEIKKKILAILAETIQKPSEILKLIKKRASFIQNISPFNSELHSSLPNKSVVLDFLNFRLSVSIENSDDDETQAIISLLKDYSEGIFGGYQLLKPMNFYGYDNYVENYSFYAMFFIYKTINLWPRSFPWC